MFEFLKLWSVKNKHNIMENVELETLLNELFQWENLPPPKCTLYPRYDYDELDRSLNLLGKLSLRLMCLRVYRRQVILAYP